MGNHRLGSAFMEKNIIRGDHRLSMVQWWHALLKTACKLNETVEDHSFSITVSCLIYGHCNSRQAC